MRRFATMLACFLASCLTLLSGSGCSQPPATVPAATEPSDKMPPEVIYDPESAMQKYRGSQSPK
ncbi:MAG: hypothetical protein NZM31_02965 [Gemmatales bacterium]|nr:hypothetical protein [Gemmatales bacterium]MDW8385961.1 hypothetical protein [Gemmatales bacterium]